MKETFERVASSLHPARPGSLFLDRGLDFIARSKTSQNSKSRRLNAELGKLPSGVMFRVQKPIAKFPKYSEQSHQYYQFRCNPKIQWQ